MIKLSGLHKKYDHRGIAGIHDLSLTLHAGEIFCLMGPNGSGKTTLLNLLDQKILADSGELEILEKITFFQEEFFSTDPSHNVLEFLIEKNSLDLPRDKKLQLARDFADVFEFTFQLRQNFGQLSAGQKQKVQLAAMLVSHPTLILLDEPFHHLDPFTRQDILQTLFSYLKTHEISVLWITHHIEEAMKFSDRLGLLNFGKLTQVGTPLEILSHPKNLFVAKFLGFENLLSVKKENGKWMSPWGEVPAPDFSDEEAVLIIPENAWGPSSNPLASEIKRSWPTLIGRKFEIETGEFRFIIQTDSFHITDREALTFSPILPKTFLIPL
jgi:ABC-type multidrug transport system ATPase subunit